MNDTTAFDQIDDIIEQHSGWKGDAIKRIRSIILDADPAVIEAVKWKMPSRPAGLPVWTRDGIICFTEIWKDNIKLIFFKGAQLTDPDNLFNARLKSSSIRAIELHEGDLIDARGIKSLVLEAVQLNIEK